MFPRIDGLSLPLQHLPSEQQKVNREKYGGADISYSATRRSSSIVIPVIALLAVAAGGMFLGHGTGALANDVASSTIHFEGTLTNAGGGVVTGTILATAGEYYVPGGPGEAIEDQGGFDLYAKQLGTAYVEGTGSYTIGPDHDAYSTAGPWGTWYDPDVADWNMYELELTADHWYLRYAPTGESPMSGPAIWNGDGTACFVETDLGTQSGGYGGSAAHGGGAAAWDWENGWGVEVIPLEMSAFEVLVTPLGGGAYEVSLSPAACGPVGGITDLLVGGSAAPASAGEDSDSSVPLYASLAAAVAAAVVAMMATGGWYVRRRWLS